MANPLDSAVASFQGLHTIDNEDAALALSRQSHDLAKQQFASQQAALQFQQARETASDQRTADAAQRGLDQNTGQALQYNVTNAQNAGQDAINYDDLPAAQQDYGDKVGAFNTGIKVDPSKMTVMDLKNASPVFAGMDQPQIAQAQVDLQTMKTSVENAASQLESGPNLPSGPTNKGKVFTAAQDPAFFDAFNRTLVGQVNKGLDDRVASKKAVSMVYNPDHTVSVEVESFDKDGDSLGLAPVTYGRENGNPDSEVLKIPATSFYDYLDTNGKAAEAINAQLIQDGDNGPMTRQQEATESGRALKALLNIPEGERTDKEKTMVTLLQGKASLAQAHTIGSMRLDKTDPALQYHENVLGADGKPHIVGRDRNGKIVTDSVQYVKPDKPDALAVLAAGQVATNQRMDKADDKSAIDKIGQRVTHLQDKYEKATGRDKVTIGKQITKAKDDYSRSTAAFQKNWKRPYDPESDNIEEATANVASDQNATRIAPAVKSLKSGMSLNDLRAAKPGLYGGWNEADLQNAALSAGVPYTPPRSSAPALAPSLKPAPAPARPALAKKVSAPLQVGKYKVQVN